MTMNEKLLVLWILAMVIVAFVVTHVAGQMAFAIENCFAAVLPLVRG